MNIIGKFKLGNTTRIAKFSYSAKSQITNAAPKINKTKNEGEKNIKGKRYTNKFINLHQMKKRFKSMTSKLNKECNPSKQCHHAHAASMHESS